MRADIDVDNDLIAFVLQVFLKLFDFGKTTFSRFVDMGGFVQFIRFLVLGIVFFGINNLFIRLRIDILLGMRNGYN